MFHDPRKSRGRRTALLATAATVALAVALAGCETLDRLGEAGEGPRLTNIQNPTARPGYRPVTMPMPAPQQVASAPNSLWRKGSRYFFKDQRASQIGDIISVSIVLADQAVLNNSTTRTRVNAEDASLTRFFGYEASLSQILPEAINPAALVDADSSMSSAGTGTMNRTETIQLKLAAVVTQILPNGNLVIQGRQEIRVNQELREVEIAGVIRPEDIKSNNVIEYENIAEARILYTGRGVLADVQQPRYGQQVFDVLFPF